MERVDMASRDSRACVKLTIAGVSGLWMVPSAVLAEGKFLSLLIRYATMKHACNMLVPNMRN